MVKIFRILVLTVAVFNSSMPTSAQWLQTNCPQGGTVTCFAGIPSYSEAGINLFAGVDGGGIFRTTDNGSTWTAVNQGLTNTTVYALAVSPDSSKLFAGTYDGVFLSADEGGNWIKVSNGLLSNYVNALIMITDSGVANLFAGTFEGVFRSTDSGSHWSSVNIGLTRTSVYSFAADSAPEGIRLFAGTYGGVFLSSNKGMNWTTVMGPNRIFVYSLAVDSDSGNTKVFAGTSSGVFLTTNDGMTWNLADDGLTYTVITSLILSSFEGRKVLFAGTYGGGIFLSTNDGTSWSDVSSGLTNKYVTSLFLNKRYGEIKLYAGVYGEGVWQRPLSEMITSADISSNEFSASFKLEQNSPNPFNPTTQINYSILKSSFVSLKIYDLLGRELSALVNEIKQEGRYSVIWNADRMPAGTYFYRFSVEGFIITKKMLLLR